MKHRPKPAKNVDVPYSTGANYDHNDKNNNNSCNISSRVNHSDNNAIFNVNIACMPVYVYKNVCVNTYVCVQIYN